MRWASSDNRSQIVYELDGQIELYDLGKRARVGKPVSVCHGCHEKVNIWPTSILCGIDSVWK